MYIYVVTKYINIYTKYMLLFGGSGNASVKFKYLDDIPLKETDHPILAYQKKFLRSEKKSYQKRRRMQKTEYLCSPLLRAELPEKTVSPLNALHHGL
jgi:hypothetical protein